MSFKSILFSALIFLSLPPSLAEAKTIVDSGRTLAKYCSVAPSYFQNKQLILDNPDGLICLGYFQGVLDIILNNNGAGSCIPDNVTMDQLIKVFLDYSDKNPERVDRAPLFVLFESFNEKFPCESFGANAPDAGFRRTPE